MAGNTLRNPAEPKQKRQVRKRRRSIDAKVRLQNGEPSTEVVRYLVQTYGIKDRSAWDNIAEAKKMIEAEGDGPVAVQKSEQERLRIATEVRDLYRRNLARATKLANDGGLEYLKAEAGASRWLKHLQELMHWTVIPPDRNLSDAASQEYLLSYLLRNLHTLHEDKLTALTLALEEERRQREYVAGKTPTQRADILL